MTKGNGLKMNLPSVDDIFTIQAERDEKQYEKVIEIPIKEISDFPNHPFKVSMDEKMIEMIDSVKRYGVLVPALARPGPDDGYQMIAGHRRKYASQIAGYSAIPCIVREMTDDEATIVMVDSNLQREEMLPSEKAFAYKMKLEAMKRQGQRTDLTSVPAAQKLKGKTSRQILAEQAGEKGNQKEQFRIPKERISKYFSPGTPAKRIEETIVKALELYRKRERERER